MEARINTDKLDAVRSGRAMKRVIANNTTATREAYGVRIRLHGHTIARIYDNGLVSYTLAGYGTATTRGRLNSLSRVLGHHVVFSQKDSRQCVNGRPVGVESVVTVLPGDIDPSDA